MAIFSIFQDGGCRHFGFLKVQIFNVQLLKKVELRHKERFRRNWWNHCRDNAIFRFFQDGGRPPSWICYARVRTTHEGHLMVFIAMQNLVEIGAVVLIICMFFDFASLA